MARQSLLSYTHEFRHSPGFACHAMRRAYRFFMAHMREVREVSVGA
jgi:hypothetical protein